MGVLVQIRDVPDEVHRTLKSRAAGAGVSLSEYLRTELARNARRPSTAELAARIAAREPGSLGESSQRSVRRLRDRDE